MAQRSRNRSQNRTRQPQSLESLYKTTQNFCNSIQKTLDAVGQQCISLHIDKEDQYVMKVLERINAFDDDLNMDALSDAQCQLLIEDLELDIDEGVALEIVKGLRDLELLRKSAADFFSTLNKRLSSMLDNGVYVFCASLIELTQENVNEVIEYNDFISKQRSELTQAVDQIKQYQEIWSNLTMDTQSTLNHLKELGACLEGIREEWNKIRAKTIEWINQDREYPTRLANRIKEHRETMQGLLLEIEAISETKQQKTGERRHRELRMEALQKRRRELCSNLRLVQRAKRFNATKLAAFDSDSAQTEGDREECNSAKPSTTSDGGNAINDSKPQKELYRRRDTKLEKEQNDIKSSLKNVNKRITDLQRAAGEDERESDTNERRLSEIETEIAQIKKISTDCREILLQRGKVQTLLQLQRGVVAETSRGKIPFERICKFVALRVRHEWPSLYLHLPMWPTRSLSQRQDDITTLLGFERMNVVLPRNRTSVEDAAAALEKWRLLSRHYVDVDGLATGLSLAGWSTWAKEVRSRFGQEVEVVAESEKAKSEAEEAEDVSAEVMLGPEIEEEAVLSADNEEARLNRDEMGTPSKSLHDTTSEITGHQNWGREPSTSESIHRDSVINMDKQSSLSDEDQQCLDKSIGSTTQRGEVMEVSSAEKEVLAQESCTSEESSQKPSMSNSRSGSIANESEKEEQNSFNDPSGNSLDIPSEQEEHFNKSNQLSEEHKEEDTLDDPPVHFSRGSSLSNNGFTRKNSFSRRMSRHNTHRNQDANPYTREEPSKTSTKDGDSDDNISQGSFDKNNKFTKKDDWNSSEISKVESIRSEKDKKISSRKKTLDGGRSEIKASSAQTSLTSKKPAKQKPTNTRLKDEKSKKKKQLNEKHASEDIAEIKEDECPNSCTPHDQAEIDRLHAEDEKNETKEGALDDKENAAAMKSDPNEQENEQESDKISKSSFDAGSGKVEDEDSKPQNELLTHERKDSSFDSDYSKKHSLIENDDEGNGNSEQFSSEDRSDLKSAENNQKPPPKSKVSLTSQRISKTKKSAQSSKDKKKSYKILGKKTKAGSKSKQEGLTKGLEREEHGAESSTLSQKEVVDPKNSGIQDETNRRVTGTSMGSELSRETSIKPKSKKGKWRKS
ncbi:unnamed protein product [Taenia asiatica]|uniref:Death domain-containing protein n=1 Tax=Taenia asiatica TaxID=60517 RepID=A0A0R3W2V6_TAEAS|nr:unnamed protein product [Taenia asiatica]